VHIKFAGPFIWRYLSVKDILNGDTSLIEQNCCSLTTVMHDFDSPIVLKQVMQALHLRLRDLVLQVKAVAAQVGTQLQHTQTNFDCQT